jgi:MFS family permease
MAMLGGLLARFGFRTVITVGAAAYFVRYMIWSLTGLPVALLVTSQVLHGVCYACFFASAFIYTDRVAPPDVRHSAQTVFGIIILGGGPVLGGLLAGWLADTYAQSGGALDYGALWRVVSLIGLAATLFVWAGFRERMLAAEG